MLALMVCSLVLAADPPPAEKPADESNTAAALRFLQAAGANKPVTTADPPPAEKPKPADDVALKNAISFLLETQKPDDLQTALTNHPDVQIAEAKLRIAQAELAKVKLMVSQQVTAARAKVAQLRADTEGAEKNHKRVQELQAGNAVPAAQVELAAQKHQQAKAGLAAAEAELRAMLGVAPGGRVERQPGGAVRDLDVTGFIDITTGTTDRLFVRSVALTGSVADKLRAVLDKPITLKAGLDKVRPEAALDALKQAAGFDFVLKWGPGFDCTVSLPAGQRTLLAWLDLLTDEFDRENKLRYRVTAFVREYGLLLAAADSKPPGAITLAEFAKQADKPAPAAGVSDEVLGKVRAVLPKVVKLGAIEAATAEQFLRGLLKEAGGELDAQTRSLDGNSYAFPAGTKTVAAWLEQFTDMANERHEPAFAGAFFVREYGLFFGPAKDAPPGAVPLSQVK